MTLLSIDKHEKIVRRFWNKVNKDGPLPSVCPELGQCWVWKPKPGSGGYGNAWDGIRIRRAHVLSYEFTYGPVPDGNEVCHRCNNKACVRPIHLYAGTHQQNMDDIRRHGGRAGKKPIFTPEQKSAIRSAYLAGEKRRELADRFGCAINTIGSILRGIRKTKWVGNRRHKSSQFSCTANVPPVRGPQPVELPRLTLPEAVLFDTEPANDAVVVSGVWT